MPGPTDVTKLDLLHVLQSLADGVSIADTDGRIVFSNDAANRILGTPPTDQPPEEWASHYGVFAPNGGDEPFHESGYPLVRALAGEETHEVEMLIRNPALPQEVTISSSSRPLRDADGSVTGAVVVFRDVTKLRRAQRALEQANAELSQTQRKKDELAAFVVHDLKNPITTIMLIADLLLDSDEFDPEAVRSDLIDIQSAAGRMHRMALDLLDIQLAEDGNLHLDLEWVPVPDLIEEVRDAVRPRAPGIRVGRVDVDSPLFVDRSLLARVLINLVDNCVKYGPEGGRIFVQANAGESDTVHICVEDEGPGVPEDLRERIFDKYAQIERAKSRQAGDSRGLGLRFCKVIVEAHNGQIWVEDAQPTGSRFCVELPTRGPGRGTDASR